MSASADELAAALRARGLRMTPQRREVLDAVRRLGHAPPEEIAAPVVGVAVPAVYRTLQVLEDLGLLAHTHFDHGAPSYRSAEDAHVHVVCHTCGSVQDAPPDLPETLARRLRDELDFTLDLAHFTVFGRCGKCVGDAAAAEGHLVREHGSHAHA